MDLCVSEFLVSFLLFFFFLRHRNVSLKGRLSLLLSSTLAPSHPLRSPECARSTRGPATLWSMLSSPTLLASAVAGPTDYR